MEYQKHTFDNGVRLIFTPMPQTRSVGVSIFVGVGSRFETVQNNGISHFLEHLVFKGTKSFPSSRAVSEAIEGRGGVLNGYTSESVTNYHAKVLPEEFRSSFKVLAELVSQPLLRAEDLEEERGVILEEISRKEDNPQDKIFDNIGAVTFPGHPLGFSTLGTSRNIKSLKKEDFESYRSKYYQASNIIVSIAGRISHDQVLEAVSQTFSSLSKASISDFDRFNAAQTAPVVSVESKKTEQAYFCLSLRSLNLFDPRRYQLYLLNSVLGSGMSSRLFLNIREKGLAYFVGSSPDLLPDTGALFVFAGFNVSRIKEALVAVLNELRKLKEELVGEAEFEKALEKHKGPILFQLEDPNEVAEWYGKQEMIKGEIETEEDVLKKLEAVKREDVQQIANDLFKPSNLNLAIIGPYSDSDRTELLGLLEI